MKMLFEFYVSINGESAQKIITEDSLYHVVALNATKTLKFTPKENGEMFVKIWQVGLVDRCGAYIYQIKDGKSIYQKK